MAYSNESIKSLGLIGGIRKNPSSIGLEGNQHLLVEILANSLDEARHGFGNRIIIKKNEDESITVTDFGRGIPLDWNEKFKKYNHELVLATLYAGGKYENKKSGIYKYPLGTNGVGCTGTNFTSDFMTVRSVRDGFVYNATYEKGIYKEFTKEENKDNLPTGTSITFKPSAECFRGSYIIEDEFINTLLYHQSIINSDIAMVYHNKEGKETSFYYKSIEEYIESISEGKNITPVFHVNDENEDCREQEQGETEESFSVMLDLYFTFNNHVNKIDLYHNSSFLEDGGSPENAIKTSFLNVFNKFVKDEGLLKKGEKNLTFEDIAQSLIFISSTFSTNNLYTGQSKKKMKSKFLQDYMTEVLKDKLTILCKENKKEFIKIANQLLNNKRARETSEKTRLDIKKKFESKEGTVNGRPNNIIPAETKDPTIKKCYILEGRSAKDAVKRARNPKTDEIYPIRGKLINILNQSTSKIISNAEIRDLYLINGCGMSHKGKPIRGLKVPNMDDCNISKMIILTDSDVDGFHIRCLIIVAYAVAFREFLEDGRLYIVEAPLYKIHNKIEKYYFYSEQEYGDFVKKHDIKKYTVQRYKGLGGLEEDDLVDTVFSDENQRLTQVTIEDFEEARKILEVYFDDKCVEDRRKIVEEEGHNYFDYSMFM